MTLVIPSEFAIQTMDNFFDYEHPETSTMTIEDVALSLSNVCRWGGHCRPFFSVAQHAVEVADIVEMLGGDAFAQFVALHHDDHEAVRGDIPTPRKRYLKAHGQLFKGEQTVQDQYIYGQLLGLDWPLSEEDPAMILTKKADWIALQTERVFLKPKAKWHANEPAKNVDAWNKTFFDNYLKNRNWELVYLDRHERLIKEMERDAA